jgi:IS30 family transposase
MVEYVMGIFKQFSLEERTTIQTELNSRKSFKAIAKQLGKAPSSISQEVRSGAPKRCRWNSRTKRQFSSDYSQPVMYQSPMSLIFLRRRFSRPLGELSRNF